MGDTMLLADFDHFFANDLAEVIALTRTVMGMATEIRAVHGFHTADAIHLAAAVVAYVCSCGEQGRPWEVREGEAEDGTVPLGEIPDRATRLKIDQQVTKSAREHFVIYADQRSGQQVWHWVRREPGRPLASRDHRFDVAQSGTPLIQRLEQIAVGMAEEEQLTLFEVTGKAKKAFGVDKVTKKFYERFKAEHAAFLKFVKGIPSEADLQWYTSLMLNRLMFVYFIQKKGFLDGGRLLLLSPFGDAVTRTTAAQAQARNEFIAALCHAVLIPHASPGGKAEAIAPRILVQSQPLFTFPEDENTELLKLGAQPYQIDRVQRCLPGD